MWAPFQILVILFRSDWRLEEMKKRSSIYIHSLQPAGSCKLCDAQLLSPADRRTPWVLRRRAQRVRQRRGKPSFALRGGVRSSTVFRGAGSAGEDCRSGQD
jgi:hypothetical protein